VACAIFTSLVEAGFSLVRFGLLKVLMDFTGAWVRAVQAVKSLSVFCSL
jgi:hypothetical protein